MSNEPDSEASPREDVAVSDTPEDNHPQYGSVTMELWRSKQYSQSLRMSRKTAEKLWEGLGRYLRETGPGL